MSAGNVIIHVQIATDSDRNGFFSRVEMNRTWNKVLAIKVKHFLLKKADLKHFSVHF
jgi:hypothetical protein